MSVAHAAADVRRIAVGPVRRLFVGQLLKELGAGMTLALLVIYLHEVRGLPIPVASTLLAWQAVLALVCSPLAGSLVDRFGPRPVLMVGALASAVGLAGYAVVTTTTQAFVAMSLVAVAGAALWGPIAALTARLVEPDDRSTAFGFAFMLTNLGLGLGGLIGALIVDVHRPGTFQVLYLLTALAYVLLFLAVLSMGRVGGPPPAEDPAGDEPVAEGSWAEVLRDRRLLRYTLAGLLLLTFGYGSLDAGLGIYIRDTLALPAGVIGVLFAVNTLVIVLGQLYVLARLEGRARSRVLALTGALWAITWLLFALAAGLPTPLLAVLACLAAMAVFALGETLWAPVAPALVNDLAPEHLRGRYNSVQSVLWGVAGTLGPLASGALQGRDLGVLWALVLAAGCVAGALIALRLGHFLTPGEDGLTGPQPVDPDPAPSVP
ncbi:MAG TPA: MFS transporter [Candidatus Nanopelagicales bacterium]